MTEIALTPKQKAKIKRALKALEDVRSEVNAESSDGDVSWFLEDNGNLNLMEGDSHDEDCKARHDAVIAVFDFNASSGGGW